MLIDQKAYVYVLESNTGKYYIGSTVNINLRTYRHKSGHTQTTRNMGDFNVVLVQEFKSLIEARRVENRLKKLKRKDYIKKIVADGFIKVR